MSDPEPGSVAAGGESVGEDKPRTSIPWRLTFVALASALVVGIGKACTLLFSMVASVGAALCTGLVMVVGFRYMRQATMTWSARVTEVLVPIALVAMILRAPQALVLALTSSVAAQAAIWAISPQGHPWLQGLARRPTTPWHVFILHSALVAAATLGFLAWLLRH